MRFCKAFGCTFKFLRCVVYYLVQSKLQHGKARGKLAHVFIPSEAFTTMKKLIIKDP